jgi:iron complex outermembrane receptor protein
MVDGLDVADLSVRSLLDQKISVASRYAQSVSDAPGSVTIITADDIERFGYRTLDEMLRTLPGFYTSYDRTYVYVGTRGFSRPSDTNNRILLLINDHVVNECVFGWAPFESGLQIDPAIIQRVEIVRGPGSALYGAGAMFAVVNVVTVPGRELDGTVLSAFRTSADGRGLSASFGRQIGDTGQLMLSATWQRSDGRDLYIPEWDSPDTNNGISEGLDRESAHGLVATASIGGLSIFARHAWREKGIPNAPYGIRFNDPAARVLDSQTELEMRQEWRVDATTGIMARAYLTRNTYRGTYPYADDFLESSEGRWAGVEVQGRWDLHAGHRLTAGAEVRDHMVAEYRTWDRSATYFDGSYPFTISSLYVQDEYQLTRGLALTLGARYDRHSRFEDSLSPRLAVILHPSSSSTLKVLYGHAFRAPNLYEARFADPGIQKPNPSLGPESIRTAEVNLEQELGQDLLASASVYRYAISHLIDPVVDPTDGLLQYRNLSRAEALGLELGLTSHLEGGGHGYLSYSYEDATSSSTGQTLTNSPRHMGKLGLARDLGARLRAAVEARYESGRRTVQGSWTGGYPWVRMHLLLHPPDDISPSRAERLIDRMRLSLVIDNLLDRRFATPGGFEHVEDAIAQDGRRVSLRLELRY